MKKIIFLKLLVFMTVCLSAQITDFYGIDINIITITGFDQNGNVLNEIGCPSAEEDLLARVNCLQNNNPEAEEILLVPQKISDNLNGVSTLDMVLITRHILGLGELDYRDIMAGDFNGDKNVSATDIILLRSLIIGFRDDMPTSWKFFKESILNITDHSVILDRQEEHKLRFLKAEFPLKELKIVGIKIGDVNNSANKN